MSEAKFGWCTSGSNPPKQIFGGVQQDTGLMASLYTDWRKSGSTLPDSDDFLVGTYLATVDIPLSVVGDVLTLPVTIPATLSRMKEPVESDSKPDAVLYESRGHASPGTGSP
jgi:hypothetical protein